MKIFDTILIILIVVITLMLAGCATPGHAATDTERSASLSAQDTQKTLEQVQAANQRAEALRKSAAEQVGKIVANPNPSSAPEDKAAASAASNSLAAQKPELESVQRDTASAAKTNKATEKKAAETQAALSRYQDDDPVYQRLVRWAIALLVCGVVIMVIGASAMTALVAGIPVIGAFLQPRAAGIIGLGAAIFAGGAALSYTARRLVTIENIIGGGVIVVLASAATYFAWHAWVAYRAAHQLATTTDKQLAAGAAVWTPAATVIANATQGVFTRAVVDAAQTAATPAKPANAATGGGAAEGELSASSAGPPRVEVPA
jgi:hypothetical protein